MNEFRYKKNRLFCEDVSVEAIVAKVGTPAYIYSKAAFAGHLSQLNNAFRAIDHLICYSVKANSNVNILRELVGRGSGLDIVSGGELMRARYAGCETQKIVFSGVGKSIDEIEYALEERIYMFNIESIPELERIARIASKNKKIVSAALRVNPDVDAKTHKYITTGRKDTKFGLDLGLARELYLKYKHHSFLRLNGVHCHIGSQITSPQPFVRALKKLTKFIGDLRDGGVTIDVLNFGGGLGIVYRNEKPQTVREFADKILPDIKKLNVRLLLEPGRFIAGNAGIFVTKVEYIKKTSTKNFVIVDGAMNDLIRPSLYEAYHEILPVHKNSKTMKADIVGPVCESGDFLAQDRTIGQVKENDLMACLSAGAYGFVMASNYNSRPKVPEVLVDGDQFQVIRRRENLQDLVRGEF